MLETRLSIKEHLAETNGKAVSVARALANNAQQQGSKARA